MQPKLSSPFPVLRDLWTDPVTGLKVPKDPIRNLEWRTRLLTDAENDAGLQRELYTACSLSVLFWVNFAAFTYRVFIMEPDGKVRQARPSEAHVPFVTWEIQDQHILRLQEAIDTGFDLLTDKSRDMGSTWDHVCVFHHQWLFRDDRTFLEISRKEDCVDTFGKSGEAGSDPGTLFGKHDYLNRWLPEWMLPPIDRKRMHLLNLVNRSRIDGESANATAGSSDRRTAVLLDEMAKMDNGEDIKRSTKDVTACRVANSTPNGAGTAFSKWRMSGQVEVFPLMYWDHPEKGVGRYVERNKTTGKWEIRSPWFNQQEKERTPKEIAIEILADHIGSGETFFEAQNIEKHRRLFARPALSTWKIDFDKSVAEAAIAGIVLRSQRQFVRATRNGPWRLWTHLINNRPDQSRTYVMGCDISKGQGASNSTLSVVCVETREKIAEFADANTPPYDLARIACAAAIWFGGKKRPYMIWEMQGPGWDFGRQVVRVMQYPSYYVDKSSGMIAEKRSKRYGWHSSNPKKHEVLGILRRAYAHGGFINHSDAALDECLTYVHYDGGGIGPAEFIKESNEAKMCHGDRVISDMLALLAIGELKPSPDEEIAVPHNSIGGRLRMFKRRRDRNRASLRKRRSFNFREDNSCLLT